MTRLGEEDAAKWFQPRKLVVLFGDSITEGGFDVEHLGWACHLASAYSRKVDVVNRGLSGYNTR